MLKKKQYLITLVAAIMIFFIIFTISYYYIESSTALPESSYEALVGRNEKSIDVLVDTNPEKIERVQPDTQIHLFIVDEHNNKLEDKEIDAMALLGLGEEEIKNKFSEYDLVEFNEHDIALKRTVPSVDKALEYALGIQNDEVCIVQKEDGLTKEYIMLDMSAKHFSRYTYSLLLKEQIEISPLQKDTLLRNPHYIEKILQAYEEE